MRAVALDRPVNPPQLLAELWARLGAAGTCTATELRVLEAPPGVTEADLFAVLEAHDATPLPAPWERALERLRAFQAAPDAAAASAVLQDLATVMLTLWDVVHLPAVPEAEGRA